MIGDPFEPRRRRTLIVAPDGARDSSLVGAVAERARESRYDFTLLVPAVAHGLHRVVDPEDQCCAEAKAILEDAIPVLSEAAGAPITGIVGDHDPFAAAADALNLGAYHEVIVATRSNRLSRALHVDLPRRIAALGVRVTALGDREAHGAVAGSAA